jgi:hypothetical protein
MADNLFNELKDALQEFRDFLNDNITAIGDAVSVVKVIIPEQIDVLFTKLIELLVKLQTEVNQLDVSTLLGEDLSKVTEFTGAIGPIVEAAKKLLPGENFEFVSDVGDVISSLPSIDEVKEEISSLIDAVLGHLNTLKDA